MKLVAEGGDRSELPLHCEAEAPWLKNDQRPCAVDAVAPTDKLGVILA